MVLWFLRVVFLLVIMAVTYYIVITPEIGEMTGPGRRMSLLMISPLILGTALILIDVFWRKKNLQAISGLFFGILAGVAIGYFLGLLAEFIGGLFGMDSGEGAIQIMKLVRGLITVACVYLCASFVMQTKDDFRFIIPYVEFSRDVKGARPVLMDTSVIIDGRVVDVAATGVFDSPLIIPRFVLAELHAVADSTDSLRRNRGRRGLDVLRRLQAEKKIELTILDMRVGTVEEADGVDNKLVELASHLNGRIMTTDYNLNKVAELRGVEVVNINDMANALKAVVLPGEGLTVKIIKPGEEAGQGVGYLEDGTMVVVDHGRDHIGHDVQIDITSTLQTSAGKMIFGRLAGQSHTL